MFSGGGGGYGGSVGGMASSGGGGGSVSGMMGSGSVGGGSSSSAMTTERERGGILSTSKTTMNERPPGRVMIAHSSSSGGGISIPGGRDVLHPVQHLSSMVHPMLVGGETNFPASSYAASETVKSDIATVCSGSVADEIDIASVMSGDLPPSSSSFPHGNLPPSLSTSASSERMLARKNSSGSDRRQQYRQQHDRGVEFALSPQQHHPHSPYQSFARRGSGNLPVDVCGLTVAAIAASSSSPIPPIYAPPPIEIQPPPIVLNDMGPPLSRTLLLAATGAASSCQLQTGPGSTGTGGTRSDVAHVDTDDCGGSLVESEGRSSMVDCESHSVHSQEESTASEHHHQHANSSANPLPPSTPPPSYPQQGTAAPINGSLGQLSSLQQQQLNGRTSPGGTVYKGRGVRRYQGRYMHLPLKRFHSNGVTVLPPSDDTVVGDNGLVDGVVVGPGGVIIEEGAIGGIRGDIDDSDEGGVRAGDLPHCDAGNGIVNGVGDNLSMPNGVGDGGGGGGGGVSLHSPPIRPYQHHYHHHNHHEDVKMRRGVGAGGGHRVAHWGRRSRSWSRSRSRSRSRSSERGRGGGVDGRAIGRRIHSPWGRSRSRSRSRSHSPPKSLSRSPPGRSVERDCGNGGRPSRKNSVHHNKNGTHGGGGMERRSRSRGGGDGNSGGGGTTSRHRPYNFRRNGNGGNNGGGRGDHYRSSNGSGKRSSSPPSGGRGESNGWRHNNGGLRSRRKRSNGRVKSRS